jgi:glycosyltransferase involved in cell wall biosynthesis
VKFPKAIQVTLEYVPSFGGSAVSVMQFQKALRSSVISFTRPETLRQLSAEPSGVLHVPTARGPLGDQFAWSHAAELRQAQAALAQADLVTCHLLYRFHIEWATRLARRWQIPYLVIPHGALDPWVFTYRSWRKRLWLAAYGRRIFEGAAQIVFATHREQEKASPHLGKGRSCVIPWPVPCVDTSTAEEHRLALRQELGLTQNARLLLYFGRIHPMKRPLDTIRAVAAAAGSQLHLLVVGPDSPELTLDECRKFCQDNHIDNVHFAAPAYGSLKYHYFMGCDGYISLSHRENFGYTVAEALACARPVLITPGIDLSPDIKAAGAGMVLQGTSDADIQSGLHAFADASDDALLGMGVRGQQWARRELSELLFQERLRALAKESVVKWR